MVHFAAMDAPALPVHDSFIMHHGYGGELEEACAEHSMIGLVMTFQLKEEVIIEMTANHLMNSQRCHLMRSSKAK